MTSFLTFNAFAEARGEGLRPELRALFDRVSIAPRSELTINSDGMLQSGPDADRPRLLRNAPKQRSFRKLQPAGMTRRTRTLECRLGFFEKHTT